MTKNETKWEYNYLKLYEYILIHKQFPDKKKDKQKKSIEKYGSAFREEGIE